LTKGQVSLYFLFLQNVRVTGRRNALKELVIVGLGLYDENDVSLRGLEELKEAGTVFAETYTSLMPGLSIKKS
jgi:hypothetical protein